MIYFVVFLGVGLITLFFYAVCHVAMRKPGPVLITCSFVNLLFGFVIGLIGEATSISADSPEIAKHVSIYSLLVDLLYSTALAGLGVGLLCRVVAWIYKDRDVKPG
jgi:hypothetical protein